MSIENVNSIVLSKIMNKIYQYNLNKIIFINYWDYILLLELLYMQDIYYRTYIIIKRLSNNIVLYRNNDSLNSY